MDKQPTGTDNPQVLVYDINNSKDPLPPENDIKELEKVPEDMKVEQPPQVPEAYVIPKNTADQYDDDRKFVRRVKGFNNDSGLYYKYYNGLNQYKGENKYPVSSNYDEYPLYRNPKQVNILLKSLNRPMKSIPEKVRLKVRDFPSEFGRIPPIIDGKPDPPQKNEKPVQGIGKDPVVENKPRKKRYI